MDGWRQKRSKGLIVVAGVCCSAACSLLLHSMAETNASSSISGGIASDGAAVLPKALHSASERIRDAGEQAKQDAISIKQWMIDVVIVVIRLYLLGLSDSLAWLNPNRYRTGSSSTAVSRSLASRELQLKILRFFGLMLGLFMAKERLAFWLYWSLVIYLNEAINYSFVMFEYSQTLSATASEAKDKIIDLKDSVSQTTSNLTRSFSSLLKRAASPSNDPNASSSEEMSNSRRKRLKARSVILARVLVAKLLSYCLIYAYLQEIVEFVAFLDLPITALLFAFFIGENQLLIFKNLTNFTDRVEYIKSYAIYMLGYGTFMAIVFEYAPYGELWCSLWHLALLLVPSDPKTDKRIDFDAIKLAEIVCYRLIEYII